MNNLVLGAAALNFDGIKLPFGVNDLMGAGSQLLILVGGFVLIYLAFGMAMKLQYLIKEAIVFRRVGKVDNFAEIEKERKIYNSRRGA